MPELLDLHSKTTKALRAVSDPVMRRHGLHLGQNYVLAELWERDGRTPGEIATALRVTTPTITKMATRMAAAGLLVRSPDERDSRLVRLWLTEAGRALREPIEAELRALEAEITAELTKTERRHLMSALTKIQRSAGALVEHARDPNTPETPSR
jgi:MarR family transcriptional regulator, organic hydroperoxide resistance regulator